jgi:DNA processing protein
VGVPLDDEHAAALALAALPLMGPRRLGVLLARWPAPEAWARVRAGTAVRDEPALAARRRDPAELAEPWRRAAAALDVGALAARAAALGVGVHLHGRPSGLALLADDPEPPPVLCSTGAVEELAAWPRVAIVGTRRATRYGVDVAAWLGSELAAAGVVVVSGLAAGIDGASHRGALGAGSGAAPPVAVVGSGHDRPYPRHHRRLWDDVAAAGVVLGEVPPGVGPAPWRFPARNRIIAALAQVVVVVESGERGGSLSTVEEAAARDRAVMAVPGPVGTPTSAGTNALLADGAGVVRDPQDVLVALGLGGTARRRGAPGMATASSVTAAPADRLGAAVLDALVGGPRPLSALAEVLGEPLGDLALAVTRLVDAGRVQQRGQWVERRAGVGPGARG